MTDFRGRWPSENHLVAAPTVPDQLWTVLAEHVENVAETPGV